MASSGRLDDTVWSDFDNLRHSVKSHTVDRLKQIIIGLAEENGVPLSKTGKKQELIDRITSELEKYRYLRQADKWARARSVLYQVRNSGVYTSSGTTQTFTTNHNFSFKNAHGSAFVPPRGPTSGLHQVNNVGTSSIPHYDPYAPPRRPYPAPTSSSPHRPSPGLTVPIRFKSSPFYKIEQAVSPVVECPESTGTMDRRSQILTFSLTPDHINKLTMPGSRYQLRLYCTTNTFYSPSLSGFRSNTSLCPIEFPATCEVRVNNAPLQANLKGIKKKPGTAPPADLSKVVRMIAGQQNRIEMIYVNSQQNAPPKKFYLVVFLVEASSVEQLVDRLNKGKFRTCEEIKAQMAKSAVEDDDIVVGKQKMTLKCPLSYTRITIPCRSSKCVHPQCFDAVSWYSVMEQTTTWLCPVCENVLNPEELIVDGYFLSILEQTPESVEEVEVEPDGEWHTSDNKIGSKAWMEVHGVKRSEKSPSARTKSNPQTQTSGPSLAKSDAQNSASASRPLVVLDSDSDNEDETRVKRELSPADSSSISFNAHRSEPRIASAKAATSAVIDLTLDSEDEDVRPAIPAGTSKRKAPEVLERHEDVMYKKSRTSDTPIIMPGGERILGNGYPTRGSSVASIPESHTAHSPYQGITLPLPRQLSSSSATSHHLTPPIAHSSPSTYFPPLPPPQSQNARRFIPYNGPYQQAPPPMNGSGATHSGTAVDSSRKAATPYNPYLPRSDGTGASPWP